MDLEDETMIQIAVVATIFGGITAHRNAVRARPDHVTTIGEEGQIYLLTTHY